MLSMYCPQLVVCVSYRPGVCPLRMYCPQLVVCVSYRPGVCPLRMYCPGWPCTCHTGPEFARCACTVPAGRVRVIPARSSPAAHVLSRLAVCVSYRPGVRPLRMYCPGWPCACHTGPEFARCACTVPGWPCACHTGPEFARCACNVPAASRAFLHLLSASLCRC